MKTKVLSFSGDANKQDVYMAAEKGLNDFLATRGIVFEQLYTTQSVSAELNTTSRIHLVYTILYKDSLMGTVKAI